MAGASSEEYQESSPHSQMTGGMARATAPRSEPGGQSSQVLLPYSTPSLEREASL
jgi:hypothetical protein